MADADLRRMRACMICGLLRIYEEFLDSGCLNCEHFLSMSNSPERVMEATSSSFSGVVAAIHPEEKDSFVARSLGLQGREKGMYAIKVTGFLPDEIEDIIKSRSINAIIYR